MLTTSPFFAAAAAFLAATLGASTAHADEPDASTTSTETSTPAPASPSVHMHDGFYFRDAAGIGYATLSASGPGGETRLNSGVPIFPNANGMLLLGGTPFRGLVIGGGLSGTDVKGEIRGGPLANISANGQQLTVGPFVDWYPDPANGFHVGALVGASGARIDGVHPQLSLSMGGTIFGGWDYWIGSQTSLGVMAILSAAAPSSLVDTSGNDTGYRIAPLSAALAITLVVH